MLVIFKKFLGKLASHDAADPVQESPEQQVLRIQQGDIRLRNQFITNYQPYVAKAASRFCKRYVDPERDDEFSIALLAFNEAINQFSEEAGRSFLGFAETVIRRRLIDHVRKEQRFRGQVPYSAFDTEDDEESAINPIEIHQAIEQYEQDKATEERAYEIMELNEALAEYGIKFADLAESSPKHVDSRESLLNVGITLAENEAILSALVHKKMLPIKELLTRVSLSRKTLERNRKYIIAVALIHSGSYPYLQDYLQQPSVSGERGSEDHE